MRERHTGMPLFMWTEQGEAPRGKPENPAKEMPGRSLTGRRAV